VQWQWLLHYGLLHWLVISHNWQPTILSGIQQIPSAPKQNTAIKKKVNIWQLCRYCLTVKMPGFFLPNFTKNNSVNRLSHSVVLTLIIITDTDNTLKTQQMQRISVSLNQQCIQFYNILSDNTWLLTTTTQTDQNVTSNDQCTAIFVHSVTFSVRWVH